MIVEPTCRYCQRRLGGPLEIYDDLANLARGATQPYARFNCLACDSTQYYQVDGKPLHYWFYVSRRKYQLYFLPSYPKFQIVQGNLSNVLMELDFLPNLTPSNTTEERIKLLTLFS